MSTTTNLGITHLTSAQSQKEVSVNAALDALDAALQVFDLFDQLLDMRLGHRIARAQLALAVREFGFQLLHRAA